MGLLLIAILLLLAPEARARDAAPPSFEVELEVASVWQSRNDVQIPNDASGTRFSLVDLVGEGPVPAARATLRWNVGRRHQLHALAAPFTLREEGTPASGLDFAGTTFVAGETAEATYRFNSWRLGYRYRLVDAERGDLWIGFTAKLRDAEVKLVQGERRANDTDLGFVPLLHVAGRRFFSPTWSGNLEVEALGGGPGRAIDAAVGLRWGRSDGFGIALAYRTIEGGADVDAVYNFAWLHFAVLRVDLPLR